MLLFVVKDKAEVLMQVDQLTEVKDELTEQVQGIRSLSAIISTSSDRHFSHV